MKRGGTIFISTAVLAVTACASQHGELQIRQKPTALAQGSRPVPFRIAEARGQLALGNVALALESFRKARREDPNSTDALAGMATCYDRMGRFELSRRYYEAALALAPADVQLLAAFAGSLQLQGKSDEALEVRREIAARSAPAAAQPQPQLAQAPEAPAAARPQPKPQQLTRAPVAPTAARPQPKPQQLAQAPVAPAVAAPQPKPQQLAQAPVAPAVARPQPMPQQLARAPVAPAVAAPQPKPQQLAEARVAPAVQPRLEPAPAATAAAPAPAPAEQVTHPAAPAQPGIAPAPAPAPALRAAAPAVAAKSVTVKLPPARPVAAKPAAPARPKSGPRLERLSLGEIALVTAPGPLWRPTVVAETAQSTTVRWVPLREASAAQVRLLNAARVDRLAARTRAWLAARGWRSMAIGDAPTTLARSLIVYPRGQRRLAQTLSNQFGFAAEERPDVKVVTMLLGRDAARIEELRPRDA